MGEQGAEDSALVGLAGERAQAEVAEGALRGLDTERAQEALGGRRRTPPGAKRDTETGGQGTQDAEAAEDEEAAPGERGRAHAPSLRLR